MGSNVGSWQWVVVKEVSKGSRWLAVEVVSSGK